MCVCVVYCVDDGRQQQNHVPVKRSRIRNTIYTFLRFVLMPFHSVSLSTRTSLCVCVEHGRAMLCVETVDTHDGAAVGLVFRYDNVDDDEKQALKLIETNFVHKFIHEKI